MCNIRKHTYRTNPTTIATELSCSNANNFSFLLYDMLRKIDKILQDLVVRRNTKESGRGREACASLGGGIL